MEKELERLVQAKQGIIEAYEERIEAVLSARAQGITWREIAAALGMTERGVTKLVERYMSEVGDYGDIGSPKG